MMSNTYNIKELLIDKFGSIKGAADRLDTTEQNIYRMIRNDKLSMKFLSRLAKAIHMSESDVLSKIKEKSRAYNINTNTVTNTVNECNVGYNDELEKLRKELSETKDKLLKCNEELIQFYKKNI